MLRRSMILLFVFLVSVGLVACSEQASNPAGPSDVASVDAEKRASFPNLGVSQQFLHDLQDAFESCTFKTLALAEKSGMDNTFEVVPWDPMFPVVVEIPQSDDFLTEINDIRFHFPTEGHSAIPGNCTIFYIENAPKTMTMKISMIQDPVYDDSVIGERYAVFGISDPDEFGNLHPSGLVTQLSTPPNFNGEPRTFSFNIPADMDKPLLDPRVIGPDAGGIPPADDDEDDEDGN